MPRQRDTATTVGPANAAWKASDTMTATKGDHVRLMTKFLKDIKEELAGHTARATNNAQRLPGTTAQQQTVVLQIILQNMDMIHWVDADNEVHSGIDLLKQTKPRAEYGTALEMFQRTFATWLEDHAPEVADAQSFRDACSPKATSNGYKYLQGTMDRYILDLPNMIGKLHDQLPHSKPSAIRNHIDALASLRILDNASVNAAINAYRVRLSILITAIPTTMDWPEVRTTLQEVATIAELKRSTSVQPSERSKQPGDSRRTGRAPREGSKYSQACREEVQRLRDSGHRFGRNECAWATSAQCEAKQRELGNIKPHCARNHRDNNEPTTKVRNITSATSKPTSHICNIDSATVRSITDNPALMKHVEPATGNVVPLSNYIHNAISW